MFESNCAFCGTDGLQSGVACGGCHASPQWQDLFQAGRFASTACAKLHDQDVLSELDLQRMEMTLASLRLQWSRQMHLTLQSPADSGLRSRMCCRQCGRAAEAAQKFCATCGGPTGARADTLRYLDFLISLFNSPLADELTPGTALRCVEALGRQQAAIETELKAETAMPTTQEAATLPTAVSLTSTRRSLMEILLDPQSIRWLLASGGGLLVVGLVIFLSSLGVFKNAIVVASGMGLGTLATLAGGIATIRFTRHRLAGRAIALLGCLVMPLNLWFYNAHQLVTLDGHLWIVATVCCALYAAAAFALEDPMFVYVLFGGIVMTGMLVLGDLHRLMEISSPATLLVTLGLISLHAERAFADDDGPFSRNRFGLACFWSAHAMIGLGLVMLLGSQVAGYVPAFAPGLDRIASLQSNPILALGLALAGVYAYGYSALVVRRKPIYEYLAFICLLWAQTQALQLGHLTHQLPALLSAMAITSLAMNVATVRSRRSVVASPLAPLALGLVGLAVLLGALPPLRSAFPGLTDVFDLNMTWRYVAAMGLVAVCSRVAATLNIRKQSPLGVGYLIAAVGATFLCAAGILPHFGVVAFPSRMMVLMALPLMYLLAARLHRDGPTKRALPNISSAAAIIFTFVSLIVGGSQWISPAADQATTLWLAGFAFEAAIFFAAAAATTRTRYFVSFSAVMVCGAMYQLVGFWSLPTESLSVAVAIVGVIGLILHRSVIGSGNDKKARPTELLICANSLASLPMVGVLLMSLSRLATGQPVVSMLITPTSLSGLAVIAALATSRGTRRWYVTLMLGQVALTLLALAQFSTLSLPRKLELFSVVAGLGLVVAGYGMWYRRQDGKSDAAAFCLLIGPLMAGLPPAVFAVINRFGFDVSLSDELTLVTVAVLLFLTGIMARVRATTLIGGALLLCHLITLIVFTGMKAQLALGAYVALGGAALFVIGVVLSIYREQLLDMPQRIKHRQGLFRVLAWT